MRNSSTIVVNLVTTLLSETQYVKFKIWSPMDNNTLWLLEVARTWLYEGELFKKAGDGVPGNIKWLRETV